MRFFENMERWTSRLALVLGVTGLTWACSGSDGRGPAAFQNATDSTSATSNGASTSDTTTGGGTTSTSTESATSNASTTTASTTSGSATTGTTTGSTTGDASTSAGGASTNGSSTDDGTTGGTMSSMGCGATSWPEAGAHSLDVDGVTRDFISGVPDGYDASTPQRLVFAFHGRTGTAEQIANGFNGGYYGLENLMDNTIFVAPQGLGTDQDASDTGWPNTDGQDIAFVEAMLDYFESNYCIDSARIYSTGFSYGGIMSNTIACQLGSRFRAVAPMAGALLAFGQNACLDEPIAAWFTHGTNDDQVDFAQGEAARDAILQRNGCDANATEPVDPSPCVAYQNCLEGYPVHWCQTDLMHQIPDFASSAIAAFLLSF